MRVGEFLRIKLTNMARWIKGELGDQIKTSVDYEQYIAERTETELAYVVGILSTNSSVIDQRNWDGLAAMSDCPKELISLFALVREREQMHDKFWRYLEMFVQVISNAKDE